MKTEWQSFDEFKAMIAILTTLIIVLFFYFLGVLHYHLLIGKRALFVAIGFYL